MTNNDNKKIKTGNDQVGGTSEAIPEQGHGKQAPRDLDKAKDDRRDTI